MIAFRGILFVTSAVFAFLLARLTQVGWLYLFDAMLWGAVLVSVVLPWLAVPSLSVRRRVLRGVASGPAPSPSEGETVQVEVALNNGRAWPRYLLTLKYHCPLADPEHSETELYVPRLDTGPPALLTSAAECHRRGMFHFGPVTVESSAPFGLFRRRRRLQSPLSVLVYPRVYPLDRHLCWKARREPPSGRGGPQRAWKWPARATTRPATPSAPFTGATPPA